MLYGLFFCSLLLDAKRLTGQQEKNKKTFQMIGSGRVIENP